MSDPTDREPSRERRIWKFAIEHFAVMGVPMPAGAEIIHVAMQHGALTIWAIVDPDQPVVIRRIQAVGTGRPVPAGERYVGTVHADPFVWHVFDGGEATP